MGLDHPHRWEAPRFYRWTPNRAWGSITAFRSVAYLLAICQNSSQIRKYSHHSPTERRLRYTTFGRRSDDVEAPFVHVCGDDLKPTIIAVFPELVDAYVILVLGHNRQQSL